VDLPPRIVKLKKTQFSIEERTFSDKLETESREQFQVNIKCELDTSLSPLVSTD
jgi:hypothetical protein